ncbi:MAG TPA: hypothetical protein VFV95_04415 [Vicinamibacterales bacterium]|nr:hypothetical protein [Vicinamibacterales bacterium]
MKYRTIVAAAVAVMSTADPARLHGAGIDPRRPVDSQASETTVENGRLEAGDKTIGSGEYVDEIPIVGRRGERVTIDLRSRDFDPYVVLVGRNGKLEENDDYEGDPNRALLSVELPEDGVYRVVVTSFEKGESGAYSLRIAWGGAAPVPTAGVTAPRIERGSLGAGDQTLKTGEYMDLYMFEGEPGQRLTLDVASRAFDTYLILIRPTGDSHENDDAKNRPGHSVIEMELTEAGTYKAIVTSFKKGSIGDYVLSIGLRSGEPADATEEQVAIGN